MWYHKFFNQEKFGENIFIIVDVLRYLRETCPGVDFGLPEPSTKIISNERFFDDILLITTFNNPFYELIQTLELIYRPVSILLFRKKFEKNLHGEMKML